MCGITAIFAYAPDAPPVNAASLARSCYRMACRGPDDHGTWISMDGRVALGHRRLAIIDLSKAGAQPMRDEVTGSLIVFNGEIYNYRELRSTLVQKGHRFRSTSDTEVLLKLYAEHGHGMVTLLRGMFAFAIWDTARGGLFLARDHFGIKPLYIADDGRTIRIASEVKALVAMGEVDTRPDPAGHAGFFLWGHVPDPFTLHRGIRSLAAGHTMWVADGRTRTREYASVRGLFHDAEQQGGHVEGARESQARLRDLLLGSVRAHLVADVEVGVFLSAGLDSTTIAALATECGGRLRTVTLGFEEFRGTSNDEVPLAEMMARHIGANHTTVWVTRNDFMAERERLFDRMDQPTTDGVNSYFVVKAAAQAGLKVVLSGLGGDELFGGYPSFRQLPRLVSAVSRVPASRALGRALRTLIGPVTRRLTSPKFASVLEYGEDMAGAFLLRRGMFMPWELPELLGPDCAKDGLEALDTMMELRGIVEGLHGARFTVSALEGTWYMRNQLLRDADWSSMTHSVEVRTPLVDWDLWAGVARLTMGHAALTKLSMAGTAALPPDILNRAKTGFGIPIRHWLAEEGHTTHRGLRGWAREVYRQANSHMPTFK